MCNFDTKYTNHNVLRRTFASVIRNNTVYIILIVNMMEEILEQTAQEKQPIVVKTTSSTAKRRTFSPQRFSVKGLRKHPGIQTSRNPVVFG